MDRYKFRGKRLDNGEWLYGDLIHNNEQVLISPVFNEPYEYPDDFDSNVDPATVGQYTGVKDFYDGDIAKSPTGAIGIIKWHDSWCGFYFKMIFGHNEYRKLVRMNSSVPLYNDLPKYEKLGTIHDNPELLEGEG